MNINIKLLLITLGIFFITYIFLNWFVPTIGLDNAIKNSFISTNQSFYDNYKGKGKIEFIAAKSSTSSYQKHPFKDYKDDVLIKMMNQEQIDDAVALARQKGASSVNVGHAEFYVDVWQFLILPFIFLVSLILASPIQWRKPKAWLVRLGSLAIGILLFLLFSSFRFWVRFSTEVNRHNWLELGTLNSFTKSTLVYMNTFLMFMGIAFAACVVIWAAVTFPFIDKNQFFLEEEEI